MRWNWIVSVVLFLLPLGLLLTTACEGDKAPATPLAWIDVSTAAELRAIVKKARGRPVIVKVWGDWCTNSKQYDSLELGDADLNAALHGATRLRVNVSEDLLQQDLRKALGQEDFLVPYYAFFDGTGALRRELEIVGWHGEQGSPKRLMASLRIAARAADDESAGAAEDPFWAPIVPISGDPVLFAFKFGKDDGVLWTQQTKLERHVPAGSGRAGANTMRIVAEMEFRCVALTPAGERKMELRAKRFEVDGRASEGGVSGTVSAAMTIARDGSVRVLEMNGQKTKTYRSSSNPFLTGGFSIYLPIPHEGMRVGEVLSLPRVMPRNTLPPEVMEALKRAGIKPDFRCEYTLVGTRKIEGVDAAEFRIRVWLRISGRIKLGRESGPLDVKMTCKGTQYIALETGLPIGPAHATVLQNLELPGPGGSSALTTKADLNAKFTPLK